MSSPLRGVAPFPHALGKSNGDEKVLEETLEKVLRKVFSSTLKGDPKSVESAKLTPISRLTPPEGTSSLKGTLFSNSVWEPLKPGCSSQEKSVQMIAPDDGANLASLVNPGLVNPGALVLLNKRQINPFEGVREDFPRFRWEWMQYERVLASVYPKGISQSLLLEYFHPWLDSASKDELQRQWEKQPNLGFSDFWQHFELKFGLDSSAQHRMAWESVSLENYGGHLSLVAWQNFQAKFMLARDRCDDRTENDDYRLIYRQLTPF
jgi:hypothetical protein